MKLLDTQFNKDGRTLKQLERTEKAAIYELRGGQGLLYGYEVIKIKVKKKREVFGNLSTEREVYPNDSQFGSKAWSFGKNHKKQAFEKFDILVSLETDSLQATGTQAVLGTVFRRGPQTFTQIKRNGMAAIYQLTGGGYEVVIIQNQKARERLGFSFRECERMPTPAEWGRYGWIYLASDLAGAEKRYASLLSRWGEDRQVANPLPEEMLELLPAGCN
jgi:hypothetical protein